MKLGDCLRALSQHTILQLAQGDGEIPMCQAGHYLGLNVFLYVLPLLAILGWAGRQQLGEIAWLDIGKDAPVFDRLVIVDDCH